ncbi:MAG TPA: hypothetical protein VM571_02465 [Noviherbaspirillum sp.]|jgi:hypothetical protein|nr:hypothetical protein [Noviherbaspirillum sp.]
MLTSKQIRWLGVFSSIATIVGTAVYFLPQPTPEQAAPSIQASHLQTMRDVTVESEGDCAPNFMPGVTVGGSISVCADKKDKPAEATN